MTLSTVGASQSDETEALIEPLIGTAVQASWEVRPEQRTPALA
jgi:hypothetical protein